MGYPFRATLTVKIGDNRVHKYQDHVRDSEYVGSSQVLRLILPVHGCVRLACRMKNCIDASGAYSAGVAWRGKLGQVGLTDHPGLQVRWKSLHAVGLKFGRSVPVDSILPVNQQLPKLQGHANKHWFDEACLQTTGNETSKRSKQEQIMVCLQPFSRRLCRKSVSSLIAEHAAGYGVNST